MSHIPNSAMPHAGPAESLNHGREHDQQQSQEQTGATGLSAQASKIADYARENPKTAAAAGAALVGAIAAAAIPLVRGRLSGSETSGSGTTASSSKKSGKSKQEA